MIRPPNGDSSSTAFLDEDICVRTHALGYRVCRAGIPFAFVERVSSWTCRPETGMLRLSSSTIYVPGRMAWSELNPTARPSTPKTLDERPSRFAPNWPKCSLPGIGNRG
jgi:hypothetical protein